MTFSSNRHSASAQALSTFRLPAWAVNRVSHSQWTLDQIKDVRSVVEDAQESRWTAELRWELTIKSPVGLPFGLDEQLTWHHESIREVELTFSVPRQIFDEEQSRNSLEWKRDLDAEDPQMRLIHVRYSGIKPPPNLHLIPFHESAFEVLSRVCFLLIPLLYGVLLLLGLDYSPRGPSAATRKKIQQEQKRGLQLEGRNCKGKGDSTSAGDDLSDSSATSNSLSTGDNDLEMSSCFVLMSKGNHALRLVRDWTNESAQFISETLEEVTMLGWAIRRTVLLAVEAGMSVLGVGVDALNLVGGAESFGGNSSEDERLRAVKEAARRSKANREIWNRSVLALSAPLTNFLLTPLRQTCSEAEPLIDPCAGRCPLVSKAVSADF